jgi:hypothetical protein
MLQQLHLRLQTLPEFTENLMKVDGTVTKNEFGQKEENGISQGLAICDLNMPFLCIRPVSVSACYSRISSALPIRHDIAY